MGLNIFSALIQIVSLNKFANFALQHIFCLEFDNFWNITWIPFNFLFVGIVVDKIKVNLSTNPNHPHEFQQKINTFFTGFIKMIITWVNIFLGLFLGQYFCEDSLMVITFIAALSVWYWYLKVRKKVHFIVENLIRYEFL